MSKIDSLIEKQLIQIRSRAKCTLEAYGISDSDGAVDLDDNADILQVDDGFWVKAWVWVPKEDVDGLNKWKPCAEGCPGVAVFDADFIPPKGWVHIERCDECGRFPHDQAAAEWLTDTVGFVCVDCTESVVMTEEEANAHKHDRFRVVIPEDSARAAVDQGKLLQWWPEES